MSTDRKMTAANTPASSRTTPQQEGMQTVTTLAEADTLALRVLDDLQITEFEYHDSNYTRPLVSHLLRLALHYSPGAGRVLLIGTNPFLCHCLEAQGYTIELWTYRQRSVAESLQPYVRADTGPEALLQGQLPFAEAPYDLIVLPMILETLNGDLYPMLRALRARLASGGGLAMATANLFNLGTRWRAGLGRNCLPLPWANQGLNAGGWHTLPIRRYYSASELKTWAKRADFTIQEVTYTTGYHPFDAQRPLSVSGWAWARFQAWTRGLIPGWRDYLITFWQAKE